MAPSDTLAETVLAAIAGGHATSSTVTTLQALLGATPDTARRNIANSSAKSKAVPPGKTKTVLTKDSKDVQGFRIYQDESRALPPKARYALATEIVNISLKALSATSKPAPKPRRRASSVQESTTPRRLSRNPSLSQGALQLRSENATPITQSPAKQPPTNRRISQTTIQVSSHVASVAECARLGFSYLLSIDFKKQGMRELPSLQLETGMLALSSRLIHLGLHDAAVRELWAIKRRLESLTAPTLNRVSTRKPTHQKIAGMDAPASMLQLDFKFETFPEARSLVITYQLNVILVIAAIRKRATIEGTLSFFKLDEPWAPLALILGCAKQVVDTTKVVKQLDSLARAVLQLCPPVSSSADGEAKDSAHYPGPMTAFQLQLFVLSIRQEMWMLGGHKVDHEKDLALPFAKSLSALVRRLPRVDHNTEVFDTCTDSWNKLCSGADSTAANDGGANFSVWRLLSTLAEQAGLYDQAYELAEQSVRSCEYLDSNHARFVAARARKLSVQLLSPTKTSLDDVISETQLLSQSLKQRISGSSLDYEVLVAELWHLNGSLGRSHTEDSLQYAKKVLSGAAAGFVSLYGKHFPGKDSSAAEEIVRSALSRCGSNDVLLSWISKDTARILIQCGTLKRIADKASSRPIAQAWTSFNAGIALGRTLKLLVVQAASSEVQKSLGLVFDDESLEANERGALLEWQLKCAMEAARKAKYRSNMQKLLPELFQRLSNCYPAKDYPLRRCRVSALALRAEAELQNLVPAHLLRVFKAGPPIDPGNLGKDLELAPYLVDLKSSLDVAKAFSNGCPDSKALEPSLRAWQKILDTTHDTLSLEEKVDSPGTLRFQLASIEQYFGMLGNDGARLPVARMLVRISQLCGADKEQCDSLLVQARVFLSLGYAEKAGEVLELSHAAVTDDALYDVDMLDAIDRHIVSAEYFLALDRLDDCSRALDAGLQARLELKSLQDKWKTLSRYQLLLGQGWLVHSELSMASGRPEDALRSGMRAVKIMNSIWSGTEKSNRVTAPHSDQTCANEPALDQLVSKVSKLNLNPTPDNSSTPPRGVAFWPLVRLLYRALKHLSNIYVHHGVFLEANHLSEQMIEVAESVGAEQLTSQGRSHRCRLLISAGRIEEAELCLAHDQMDGIREHSPTRIDRLQTKAALNAKNGDFQGASDLLARAVEVTSVLSSESCIAASTMLSDTPKSEQGEGDVAPPPKPIAAVTKKRPKESSRATKKADAATKTSGKQNIGAKTLSKQGPIHKPCYVLQKLEALLTLDKAVIDLKLGGGETKMPMQLSQLCDSLAKGFKLCLYEHELIMRKVVTALQADFTFNVLAETTLALPALQQTNGTIFGHTLLQSPMPKHSSKSARSTKSGKKAAALQESLESLLLSARHSLGFADSTTQTLTTFEAHRQQSYLAAISMMLSATHASNTLQPTKEALGLDFARIHSSRAQHAIAKLDHVTHQPFDRLQWPNNMQIQDAKKSLSVQKFQEEYVDILPASWTALSLCLNEAADELYVTRYRHSQSPLILRLPFSRQKSEDAEEEVFDYHMGKTELKEIIELSNYSCHNSIDPATKGAKTDWWTTREALDRRLQELLINIENIWFGGFKGVFSQTRGEKIWLAKFRQSFEAILDRHLPSRKNSKRGSRTSTLNDQVLELFVGLGSNQDGEVELDELLADLLYFVVDVFQFSGERNAYDEIDFDSMAIEVLDALRVYHDSQSEEENGAHLILVLDRRLQAFPWENLPSLEGSSISRVDSMLTLRERIVEMRSQTSNPDQEQFTVSRASGSYILNPSSDLKSTETMLAPELAKLADVPKAHWKSIVGRSPSEDEFRTALTESSTMLYFGHGAGSQYIRPRAIRRLNKCSRVVWLMGCSSGAVTEYDELEPFSVPMAYLNSGRDNAKDAFDGQAKGVKCMAVVATLWDVTDKDIDRFSLALGEEWGLWKAPTKSTELPAKTPRKRERVEAPCTPEKVSKTPKTPKVRKTPAPPRTPARNRSRQRNDGGRQKSLAEAVVQSRDACYLRYLNGAAPVVYGVPVYLGD